MMYKQNISGLAARQHYCS